MISKHVSTFRRTLFLWILLNLWVVSTFKIVPPEESPLVTLSVSETTSESEAIFEPETTFETETISVSETTPVPKTTPQTLNAERAMYKFGLERGNPKGGLPFNDKTDLKLPDFTPCVGVELISDPDFLFSVRFIYTADNEFGSSATHGNATGFDSVSKEKFMLRDGERITKVTTYVGTHGWTVSDKLIPFVLGIQFGTNEGRTSRLYGSNKGEEISESYDGYTFGYALGRSVILVDLLQIVWQNQETLKIREKELFAAYCSAVPESLSLVIIKATYQNRDDPSSNALDVTDNMRKVVGGRKSYASVVDDKISSNNLCSTCFKELEVTYTCSANLYIYGPELNDREYTGNNIIVDGHEYIPNIDNLHDCGEHCIKESRCVGIQLSPDHQCYLKDTMVTYIKKIGWIAMAVVNRA